MPAPRHLLVALLLGAAALTPACKKQDAASVDPEAKDPADALAYDLLSALSAADEDALDALAGPELGPALAGRDLAVIARTLRWLGPVELETQSEEVVADGQTRRYLAHFDRGSVELEVTAVAGKVEGFSFADAQWQAMVDRALEAEAGSLRVTAFAFLDDEDQPLPAPTDPADVYYALSVEGLDSQFREHQLNVAKVVYDAEGQRVYHQRESDHLRFPQAEAGSKGGRVTGNVSVPGPGHYTLELEITDLFAGQSITHRIEFDLQSP
ncbi:hypothetical protein G6O69_16835 [Pseudenhygromyxa sp. WMMC2535]|uniref:hypothetical protein n=1 Tax=Pseudenhygromyxa sp. WMMC2535 TaxID=2712867 RepID=UPI0015552C58|nr:hypothetical protein [Pseudenhygromyxa sp. WMMC2535]NVB39510.1 hypothetical protein [Pseudenhygromyxa sp. WMMC2535]